MIRYILGRALIGMMTGLLTAMAMWTAVLVAKEGLSTAWELVKELGPFDTAGRFSAQWLVKTGALPAGVLGVIAAPYLGPIVGGYVWQGFERIVGPVPGINWNDAGSVVVGLVAGFLGYLLRVS